MDAELLALLFVQAHHGTLRDPLSTSILQADIVGRINAWCMTICHEVAFNILTATRSKRREPLAGWYTVVRIKAGVLGSVPALAYPKAAGLCLTLTSSPPCLAVRKGTHSQALAAQAHSWHSELPRVRVPSARSSSAARSELVGAPQPGVPEPVGAPQFIARPLSLAG